jgi:hypothetical protein
MSSTLDVASTLPLDLLLPQGTPPEDIAAIEDYACELFHRHGAAAFAAPREAALAHEASHAIVGTHEGLPIRQILIYSRSDPRLGTLWGGRCLEAGWGWTTGPETSADDDLKRARFIIAGLAGEVLTKQDRPGSSLDEKYMSEKLAHHAAMKLTALSGADFATYIQNLWHEQIWRVAFIILRANFDLLNEIASHLDQCECLGGTKLGKLLAKVKRITP